MVLLKIPLRAAYDPSGTPSGISEFSTGNQEVVGIQFGGTGGHTLAEAQANLGIGGSSINALSSLTDVVIVATPSNFQPLVWSSTDWVPAQNVTVPGILTASASRTRLSNIQFIDGVGIRDVSFNPVLIQNDIGTSGGGVNYFHIKAGFSGSPPFMSVEGVDTDIDFNLTTKGAGQFKVNGVPVSGGGVTAHSALTGLVSPANDHTQYATLSGATFPGSVTINGFLTASANPTKLANVRFNGATGIRDPNNNPILIFNDGGDLTGSGFNYFNLQGVASGNSPLLAVVGTDTNIDFNVSTKGSGVFKVNGIAVSAGPLFHSSLGGLVNPANDHPQYATLSGSIFSGNLKTTGVLTASTTAAILTNIRFNAGTGVRDESNNPVIIVNDGGSLVGSGVNYFNMQGVASGNSPLIAVVGSDTNIDFIVSSKGTGVLKVNTSTVELRGNRDISGGYISFSSYQNTSGTFSSLSALSDTTILSSVGTGQVLAWSAAGHRWVPSTLILAAASANALSGLTDTTITSTVSTNQVLAWNGTKWIPSTLPVSISSTAHSSLTGLVSPANDHTQYATLSGATFTGSIIASGNPNSVANLKFNTGTGLRDASNNPVLIIVNPGVLVGNSYFNISGSPSGTNPSIGVTGTDASMNFNIVPRGTGTLTVNGSGVELSGNKDIPGGYISYSNYNSTSATFANLSSLRDTTILSSVANTQVLAWSATGAKWVPSTVIYPAPPTIGTSALSGLSDTVILSSVSNSQVLAWSAAGNKWVPSTVIYPSVSGGGGGASSLSGLNDVTITSSVSNSQVLSWSAAGNKWVPSTVIYPTPPVIGTSALSGLSDTVILSSVTNSQALVWSATGNKWVPSTVIYPTPPIIGTSALSGLSDVVITSSIIGTQVLAWSAAGNKWVPSSVIYPSPPIIGTSALSGLSDTVILSSVANTQVLAWSAAGNKWVPSTVVYPSPGAGGGVSSLSALNDVVVTSSVINSQVLSWSAAGNKWVPSTVIYPVSPVIGTSALSGLSDVVITSSVIGTQVLAWSAGGAKWVPSTVIYPSSPVIGTSALSGLSDVVITSSVTGAQVLAWSAAGNKWVPSSVIYPAAPVIGTSALSGLSDVVITSSVIVGNSLVWSGTKWVPSAITISGLTDTSIPSTVAIGQSLTWNGTDWVPSTLNHSALAGLKNPANDHPQYATLSGATFSSNVTVSGNLTVSTNLNVSGNINGMIIGMGPSATAPSSPPSGSMWFSAEHKEMFIYYGSAIGWAGTDQLIHFQSLSYTSGQYWRTWTAAAVVGEPSGGFVHPDRDYVITDWHLYQTSASGTAASADLVILISGTSALLVDTKLLSVLIPVGNSNLSTILTAGKFLNVRTSPGSISNSARVWANVVIKRKMT
jgi:hypothetical protein